MKIEDFDQLTIGSPVVMTGEGVYSECRFRFGEVIAVHPLIGCCDVQLYQNRTVTVTAVSLLRMYAVGDRVLLNGYLGTVKVLYPAEMAQDVLYEINFGDAGNFFAKTGEIEGLVKAG